MAINNPALYNAALIGGSGGVSQRWLSDPNAADYVAIRDSLILFATAIDAALPAQVVSSDDVALMQQICFGVMAQRWISQPNANFTSLGAGIAALWNTIKGGFSDQASDAYTITEDFDCIPSSVAVGTAGIVLAAGNTNWFILATSGSGNGTVVLNGSPQTNPNHPGVMRMITPAVINNGMAFKRGQQNAASSSWIRPDMMQRFSCWFALPVVANVRMQLGMDTEPSTQAVSDGAVLSLDTSVSPFFQLIAARQSQVATVVTNVQPVASSSATPTWWKLDILQNTQGLYQFLLNDVSVGTIDRSNILNPPVNGTNVGGLITALAASAVELQVDKIELQSVPLNRLIN